jgi:hypothetical protein
MRKKRLLRYVACIAKMEVSNILPKHLKVICNLDDIRIHWRIILKYILEKCLVRNCARGALVSRSVHVEHSSVELHMEHSSVELCTWSTRQ